MREILISLRDRQGCDMHSGRLGGEVKLGGWPGRGTGRPGGGKGITRIQWSFGWPPPAQGFATSDAPFAPSGPKGEAHVTGNVPAQGGVPWDCLHTPPASLLY